MLNSDSTNKISADVFDEASSSSPQSNQKKKKKRKTSTSRSRSKERNTFHAKKNKSDNKEKLMFSSFEKFKRERKERI